MTTAMTKQRQQSNVDEVDNDGDDANGGDSDGDDNGNDDGVSNGYDAAAAANGNNVKHISSQLSARSILALTGHFSAFVHPHTYTP